MSDFETHGSADFYFRGDKETFRPKRVIVFVEGEYGFIPLIVSKSLEGKEKPIVEIMSQNQCVDAFNQMPSLMNPSWTLTQIDKNTCVLCITNWWPLSVELNANPDMWSYAYPLIRDIIFGLKRHGCESLSFFTIMNNHEAETNAELMVYDMHNNIHPEKDLILSPPAWIMPFVADRLDLRASVVCITQDEGQFIDTDALDLAKSFFMALGHAYDEEKAKSTIETVRNMEQDLMAQRWSLRDDDEGGWLA